MYCSRPPAITLSYQPHFHYILAVFHSDFLHTDSFFFLTINELQKSGRSARESSSPPLMREFISFDTFQPNHQTPICNWLSSVVSLRRGIRNGQGNFPEGQEVSTAICFIETDPPLRSGSALYLLLRCSWAMLRVSPEAILLYF